MDQLQPLVQPFCCLIVDVKSVKKILIISFSTIHSDPRVMRQVRLLEKDYQVTVAGYGRKPDAVIEFVALEKPPVNSLFKGYLAAKLLIGAFESYYWGLPQVRHGLRTFDGVYFDLIIANDISALPLALSVAGTQPVLMDAHEYSPREFDDKWLWKLLFGRYHHRLCQRYLPLAATMVTVCQGIASEYAHQYGVKCGVVHNAPLDQKLLPSEVSDQVRMIHHGSAIRSRHLEVMIDTLKLLGPRFTLDFMLVETDSVYMEELRERARKDPRISFIEPVAMQDICQRLNEYDVGIYLLPPVNFNHEHALPNKFFEFIQARLAVAIGPSPEMVSLVKEYGCGVVADSFDPQSLANTLEGVTSEDIRAYKQAANRAAAELNYERGGRILKAEIDRLVWDGI